MCEPVSIIAGAALVVSVIGAGVQAYGASKETAAANQAAEYNAQLMERNARIADMQAADATARGDVAEKQFRLQVSKLKGSQRSDFASSGVVVDTGSPLDVALDTTEQGELDALTIRHNASVEAWGYKNQAAESISQASLYRSTYRSASAAGATSLLTSTGQIAGQAATYGYLKSGSGTAAKAGV
jgi:hypothetical protein